MNPNSPSKKTWQDPELVLISRGYLAGAGPVLVLEHSVVSSVAAPKHPGHFYVRTANTSKLLSATKNNYHS